MKVEQGTPVTGWLADLQFSLLLLFLGTSEEEDGGASFLLLLSLLLRQFSHVLWAFSFALWDHRWGSCWRRLWSLGLRDSSLICPCRSANAQPTLQLFYFALRGCSAWRAAWSWDGCLSLLATVRLWSALLPRSQACRKCGTGISSSLFQDPPLPGDPWFA